MASDVQKMIQGLPEAKALFDQLAKLPDALKVELERTASDAMSQAQALAPVRTGRMRASIAIERYPGGVTLKAGKFYSRFVEWGTKKMKAEPFMRPAMSTALHQLNLRIQARMQALK